MNFKEAFKKGQEGNNFGLPTGLTKLDRAIDGIQKKTIYGIGASPKVGKTTLVDSAFVLNPFLYSLEDTSVDIEWIYYSFEIDRIRKEFKFACFFLNRDHGLDKIILPVGITHKGVREIQLSPRYLLGRLKDDNGNLILVDEHVKEKLSIVYEERIVPLFGRYNERGERIEKGKIVFVEQRQNPTGIFKDLVRYADRNGEFSIKDKDEFKKVNGLYVPNNDGKFTIVIIDHIRKVYPERMGQGWGMKQVIDKLSEYQVILRNLCRLTFVDVCHLNRSLSNVERLKFAKDDIYPTGEDFKDSGNLSEDADVILTMMNPNDPKFKLSHHFGLQLEEDGITKYPNLRSIHLVESRDTDAPQHLHVNMLGNINKFEEADSSPEFILT